jgi:hypothetical protein
MKCMPCITTRTNCLVCGMDGIVKGYKSPMVSMKCPGCGKEWRTISAMCQKCKMPSGSPYLGECKYCNSMVGEAL